MQLYQFCLLFVRSGQSSKRFIQGQDLIHWFAEEVFQRASPRGRNAQDFSVSKSDYFKNSSSL